MRPFLFISVLMIVLFSSCNVYYFENPQPMHTKELKQIPSELIGIYKEKNTDTLIITGDSYNYLSKDPKREGTLRSDKVVLKKLNDYYILSQIVVDSLGKPYDHLWEVYALKIQGNQLLIYHLSSSQDDSKLFADSVRKIVPLKNQLIEKDTLHIINPSKKQFKELLDKNLWKKELEFIKIK